MKRYLLALVALFSLSASVQAASALYEDKGTLAPEPVDHGFMPGITYLAPSHVESGWHLSYPDGFRVAPPVDSGWSIQFPDDVQGDTPIDNGAVLYEYKGMRVVQTDDELIVVVVVGAVLDSQDFRALCSRIDCASFVWADLQDGDSADFVWQDGHGYRVLGRKTLIWGGAIDEPEDEQP